jgi:hypothetical protein
LTEKGLIARIVFAHKWVIVRIVLAHKWVVARIVLAYKWVIVRIVLAHKRVMARIVFTHKWVIVRRVSIIILTIATFICQHYPHGHLLLLANTILPITPIFGDYEDSVGS